MSYIWGDKYIFTDNALEKMREYKVDRDLVKRVLDTYNRSESFRGLKSYTKIFKDHEVSVLANKNSSGEGKIFIVSVWRRKLIK